MNAMMNIIQGMRGNDAAGFIVIVGSLCAVAIFISFTGLRGRGAGPAVLAFSMIYTAVLITVPAIFLFPFVMGGAMRGFLIIAFLCYMALLMVKMATHFPVKLFSAALITAGPWFWALVNSIVTGSCTGAAAAALEEYCAAGLISFTSFWLSFPFLIFGGDTKKRLTERPGISLALMALVLFMVAGGVYLACLAWRSYIAGASVTVELLIPLAGVLVQAILEILDHRKSILPKG